MIEQDQFVHWVPSASLIQYGGYHQRATVICIGDQGILHLSIPQGLQGRGWPVGTCQIVENVPYSASGEPDTWHPVTIEEKGDYDLETCECGQVTTRQTYEAYKAQKEGEA